MAKGAIVSANSSGVVRLLHNPYQLAFLEALRKRLPSGRRAFHRLEVMAGRRGGKTKIGGVATAEELTHPDCLGWACAPSYPELIDYVMPSVFQAVPNDWILDWSKSEYTLKLRGASMLQFRSLDDPERGRGPGLDFLWIDEARKVVEKAWDTILPALLDKRGAAFLTTTPNGPDWCYHRLMRKAMAGVPGYWAVKYRTIDNPVIDRAEVEQMRRDMDPLFFQQEFEADIVNFTGSIYGQLVDPLVVETEAEIRAVWPEYPARHPTRRAIVGLDPGADHPFGAIVLMETEAGLVVVGEYLERNKAALDHAGAIRSVVAPLTPDQWAIDKSQRQMMIEFQQYGILTTPAPNDVVAGIQRVQSWLRARRIYFPKPVCPKLIDQLRAYRWAENVGLDGQQRRERVIKIDDDLVDPLRYALMVWPHHPTDLSMFEESRMEVPARLKDMPEYVQWATDRERRCNDPEAVNEDAIMFGLDAETQAEHPLGDFWA